ncbi:hypothetical protein [Paenibacillus sp. R14(2021)]|uniref:hypothetical protein n=1 Tax=Paenibacillus sp. R14(2021) TaxID=2859228 RepID=UPI001C612654|nr:hypothetical protein [Paenibacillus sp. R14(2021)]
MKRLIQLLIWITFLLSGCTLHASRYAGIEAKDILSNTERSHADLLYEFKGSTEHWAANYIIYREKGQEKYVDRFFLKYVDKSSQPKGEIHYAYKSEAGGGDGNVPANFSKEGIYNLGQSGGIGMIPRQESTVKIQIQWNGHSEEIELKGK